MPKPRFLKRLRERRSAEKHARNASALKKEIKQFMRGVNPAQWELLKHYLRTGKKNPKLDWRLVKTFHALAIEYKEAKNAGMYTGIMSRRQREEASRQATDFLRIFYPHENHREKEIHFIRLFDSMGLIRRKNTDLAVRSKKHKKAFDRGRMYLEALDPKMEERAERASERRERNEKLPLIKTDGYYERNIVLAAEWENDPYTRTTPMHEMAHLEFGNNEFLAYTIDFYYNFARGFMTPEELAKHLPDLASARQGFRKAKDLFEIQIKRGKTVAEKSLNWLIESELGESAARSGKA